MRLIDILFEVPFTFNKIKKGYFQDRDVISVEDELEFLRFINTADDATILKIYNLDGRALHGFYSYSQSSEIIQ